MQRASFSIVPTQIKLAKQRLLQQVNMYTYSLLHDFFSFNICYISVNQLCWVYKTWGPDLVYREASSNLSIYIYTPGFRACFSRRWGTAWPSGSRPGTSCCQCTPRSSCGCIQCPWTCRRGGSPDPWQILSTLYRTGRHTYSKSYLSLLNRNIATLQCYKNTQFFYLKIDKKKKTKTARVIPLYSKLKNGKQFFSQKFTICL